MSPPPCPPPRPAEREFFIDNLLVRIHFIIVMIRWTGLAPDMPTSPQSRIKSPFPTPLFRTGARRDPATCGANQGSRKHRFAPPCPPPRPADAL